MANAPRHNSGMAIRRLIRERGIYVLPNAFTIAALFCAFYAITQAIHGRYESAALAVFGAMVLDGMDGRVARLTNSQSSFGEQLDSLADMVSFGVAPALIVYQWQLFHFARIGYTAAFIYCVCAALRLALFNSMIGKGTADKRWFVGVPSPTAAALIVGLVWVGHDAGNPVSMKWWALLVTLFAGFSMIVQIPFWSFKELGGRKKIPFFVLIPVFTALLVIMLQPSLAIFLIALAYSLSGYAHYIWRRWFKRHKRTA